MQDVEYFDALCGDAVDNQVEFVDNVAIHQVFGGDVAAWGVRKIMFMERQQGITYLLQVSFCLKEAKSISCIPIYLRT